MYNRDEVIKDTFAAPEWIHFGAGNIFRAFQAVLSEKLLESGNVKTGIIVAEGYDYEIIEKMYRPRNNVNIVVTLKADGTVAKRTCGSITEALTVNPDNASDYNRLKQIFVSESLKIVSFTITEKGYNLTGRDGNYLKDVSDDFNNGPQASVSYMGKVAALVYERYLNGAYPIAMVSMDNCSHNGDKLKSAVESFAKHWEEKNLVKQGFLEYLENPAKVSFPWSMIDKITPRPDEKVANILKADGYTDIEPIVTSKNTYVAPFVNAEESEYLVIEDHFPNGKLPLDKVGVIYTNRDTVDKVEKMKVCTCLNPLHTALAVFGCLLGYSLISEEMKNPVLKHLVERIGYDEGLPVVVDPLIINPRSFIDEVVGKRLPNPFMPDAPQRIATDTSLKLPIRYGETIKAYVNRENLDPRNLEMIPLVLAGWLRYLCGVDDNGKVLELSADPNLDYAQSFVKDFMPGKEEYSLDDVAKKVHPLLADARIFGLNLYEAGMGNIVENYFTEMLSGVGAVESTLKKYVLAK